MDMSYYAVQFDTARDLLANNNPEGVTGLYAIYTSLSNSSDLSVEQINKYAKTSLTKDYPEAIVCVYHIFFTSKHNQQYKNKTISRIQAYLDIQDFKQRCFKEISEVLQDLLPQDNIEWRFDKKWIK